ncbi:MAG: phosphoadenosine phosphosulfate reductase domain-containing protein, partial [Methylophilaceae bacterium]
MSDAVTLLRPAASNPATSPKLTAKLQSLVNAKRASVLQLLNAATQEFGSQAEIAFANSMGAEDMVLTDIICKEALGIEIFSLDTGRLPSETYDLIAKTEKSYNTKLKLFFPQAETVEN